VGNALAAATWPRVLCKGASQRGPSRRTFESSPTRFYNKEQL
jgi:hypothetical protein